MSTLAIELNDSGITALRDGDSSDRVRVVSPGYAVVDGATVLTGEEALDQARLKPRRAHHRFWSELDTQPIGRPFPTGLSAADLAHAHLSAVWNRVRDGVDRVVVALPGSHSEHQMGLILGIAQACEMPIEGIVDSAVAAAATVSTSGHLLHLDLELNRVVLTELTSTRELVRRRVQVGDHTGLVPLRDAWVKRIAKNFVSRTRFDPLHLATTEQALYRRLVELLPLLCRETRAVVEMEAGGRIHAVEVDRAELVESVAADYEGLLQLVRQLKRAGQAATILLSDRVAALPGFEERLQELGDVGIVRLRPAAAAEGALRHVDSVRSPGEALPYITRLVLATATTAPDLAEPRPPSVREGPRRVALPTHLVHDGCAYPITEQAFVVGTAVPEGRRGLELGGQTDGVSRVHCSVYRTDDRVLVEDHSSHGSFLNGQRVHGTAPAARGDRLRVGIPGVELQFVTVTDDDATPRD